MRRYFSGGFVAARAIVLLAALAIFAGCADGASEPEAQTDGVATLAAALTAEQCTFFAEGDKVTICRATPSARKPYVIIRTSTEACINAFANDGASYIAHGDPTCSGLGCFPEGAPYDGSVECCDGLGPIDGYCADIDACASAPCDADATCTDLPAPAPDGPEGRVCACDEGFEGDGEVGGCADIDACASAPCDADATCTDLPAPAPDGPEGRACACDEGFEGDGEVGGCAAPEVVGTSCLQLLEDGHSRGDGTYRLAPYAGGPEYEVYCDMTTDGGGWTLVAQRNQYGSFSTSFAVTEQNVAGLATSLIHEDLGAPLQAHFNVNTFMEAAGSATLRVTRRHRNGFTASNDFTWANRLRDLHFAATNSPDNRIFWSPGQYWCTGHGSWCKSHNNTAAKWDASNSTGSNWGMTYFDGALLVATRDGLGDQIPYNQSGTNWLQLWAR